ncbi:MAG: NfeD family protein [Sphingomonadales bacterium]
MFEDLAFNHWVWLGIALILAVLELVVPAVFFLWLSIAAVITAGLVFFAPGLGWELHLTVYAVLAIVITWTGRRYVKRHQTPSEDEGLNRRAEGLIGRTFTLVEAIDNGVGRIKVGDSAWRVTGPDLPKDSRVKVVGADGSSLHVEPIS